ncbi:MAG: hypothetical protein EBS32_11430 [Actinobacteria bacterium]|nr:hypothetical protein [Actinomycetota bacterium]
MHLLDKVFKAHRVLVVLKECKAVREHKVGGVIKVFKVYKDAITGHKVFKAVLVLKVHKAYKVVKVHKVVQVVKVIKVYKVMDINKCKVLPVHKVHKV